MKGRGAVGAVAALALGFGVYWLWKKSGIVDIAKKADEKVDEFVKSFTDLLVPSVAEVAEEHKGRVEKLYAHFGISSLNGQGPETRFGKALAKAKILYSTETPNEDMIITADLSNLGPSSHLFVPDKNAEILSNIGIDFNYDPRDFAEKIAATNSAPAPTWGYYKNSSLASMDAYLTSKGK